MYLIVNPDCLACLPDHVRRIAEFSRLVLRHCAEEKIGIYDRWQRLYLFVCVYLPIEYKGHGRFGPDNKVRVFA